MPCLQNRASQPSAVQRHHMEIALVCLSGTILCCSLWSSGPHAWSWQGHGLLISYILALVLEFGTAPLVSPYNLRRSQSHGIAQGVLAVPSVLAALAATTPEGNFDHWLLGSCAASVALLLTVYLQSRTAVACTRINNTSAAHRSHVDTTLQQKQQQVQDSSKNHSKNIANKHTCQHIPTLWPCMSAASVACLAATIVSWQAPFQELLSSQVPSRSSLQPAQTADVTYSSSHAAVAAAAAAVGATAAPTLYCLIMQVLPGCFSIGEGALMAQGAAAVLVASVQSLSHAPLFIPAAVCHWMPQPLQPLLRSMHSCNRTAHQQALSLEALSAAVILIVAAVLLVCLLLRGNTALLRNISSNARSSKTHSTSIFGSSLISSSRISWLAISVLFTAIGLIMLWLACAAAWTLLEFLPARPSRMFVLLYWVSLLAVTLPALRLWASRSNVPQIVIRKVYHLLAGGLFVPVFFWDLQLLCLSLAIAFAALVLLEVLRRLQLPGLGQAVQHFMQDFVDERDSGVIYVTHFTLLLGLAVPIWLCLSLPGVQEFTGHSIGSYDSSFASDFCSRGDFAGSVCRTLTGDLAAPNASSALSRGESGHGSGRTNSRDLLLVTAGLSGMVIIGVGDTAASMVGKLLGQVPIHAGSRKTVEGTVAGIASSSGAWCCLLCCVGLSGGGWKWWLGLTAATVGAGLLEACTSQLDNILLPLWYMPHLMLLQCVL